jgi:hypothetical protein
VDAQTPGTPPTSGVGTGVPLPREATDPGALTPLVPTGPPPVSLKRSRWRVVIAGFLGIVPLLCIAGIAIGFHAYDKATRPDRSTPAAVVDNYIHAYLVDRDDTEAGQFACARASGLSAFVDFRNIYGLPGVSFNWVEGIVTPIGSDSASVDVTINAVATDGRIPVTWLFQTDLVESWCVQSASRIG